MEGNEEQRFEQEKIAEIDGKYLTFYTDKQLFGLPVADVVQIVGVQEITAIPDFPHYAKGVMNLRGEIIPVMDLRLRLGREVCDYTWRTCTIVTSLGEHLIGLIVDEVDEVADIPADRISPPPHVGESDDGYMTGIARLDTKVVLLMDTGKLMGGEDLSWLQQVEG
ncbi:MAG: chemotaxis protein CheW [Oscillospiraceae bacterium]